MGWTQPKPLSAAEPVARNVGLAILSTVRDWNGRIPPSSVAGILRGDEASAICWNYGPARFPQFGALKNLPSRGITRSIELLVLKGLLRKETKSHSSRSATVLWMTEAGQAALS